ncbi:hypothetical protein LZ31DRAFT_62359 [Colletotrichum somersetense]|nr:hypothetical protein LZ31DRAFT_62359 [Colletotrichum somersetense]
MYQELDRKKNRPQPGAIDVASCRRLARYSPVALRCRHRRPGQGTDSYLHPPLLYPCGALPRPELYLWIRGRNMVDCPVITHITAALEIIDVVLFIMYAQGARSSSSGHDKKE